VKELHRITDYNLFDGLTLGQLLERTASAYPNKEALIFKDQRVTYRAFNEKVDQLAVELQKVGVRKGDRCAVLLPSSPEFVFAQYAILKLGGIFIPPFHKVS